MSVVDGLLIIVFESASFAVYTPAGFLVDRGALFSGCSPLQVRLTGVCASQDAVSVIRAVVRPHNTNFALLWLPRATGAAE